MKSIKLSLLLLLFTGFLSSAFAQQERITRFDVTIEIAADRSITVTEEISVYAAGNVIRRGITRSLPKTRDFQGKQRNMRYDILEIKRDGKAENYHSENSDAYKILYLGDEDVFLQAGNYSYSIKYRVPNQIALYEDFDELYWNAIGTDVIFSVEKASCRVILPEGIEMLQHACYTGSYGASGDECSMEQLSDAEGIHFEALAPLNPYQGLTIGIGFEKGKMQPPSFFERFGIAIVLGAGMLAMLVYFFITWLRHGIDPPRPTVFPVFESPGGRSPAALSYIWKEKHTNKSVTASIINLAVKGHIHIEEIEKSGILRKSKDYRLTRLKNAKGDLSHEERNLLASLLGSSNSFTIDGEYSSKMEKAVKKHRTALESKLKAFVTEGNNHQFLALPIIGASLFWGACVAWFALGSGDVGSQGVNSGMGPNFLALILFLPLALVGILAYAFLIRKPSREMQSLKSAIEGFQMYLEMAEEERLKVNDPFDRAPDHFEELLPYAIALGVENEWSDSFKKTLEKASYEPKWSNNPYFYHHPGYYRSFSRTMSTASTPPSSSGGSGGGGFSGGGGGGGGVGGW